MMYLIKKTRELWKGLAPDEKLHKNATYLRKCKSALQSHEGIINSAFTLFWKGGAPNDRDEWYFGSKSPYGNDNIFIIYLQ